MKQDIPCGHPAPGVDGCDLCDVARKSKKHARLWWGDAAPAKAPTEPAMIAPACFRRGAPTGELVQCGACRAGTKVKAFACTLHQRCTIDRQGTGVAMCTACPDRQAPAVSHPLVTESPPPPPASFLRRFDERNLGAGLPGRRFNASLLEWPEGRGGAGGIAPSGGIAPPDLPRTYLLAYRDGWAGSEIWLSRLDGSFTPQGRPWRLEGLRKHLESNYGAEDPRLFIHQGRAHVAYVGVVGGHAILHTSVLHARLTEDCSRVEGLWYPYYPQRKSWEKSHSYFSHGGEMYCVYSISPHRILKVEGHRAELAHEVPFELQWKYGEMRGGASPVLVGGEYFSFFHSRVEKPRRRYVAGLYTFSAAPPFRPLRIIPEPVMWADPATCPKGQYADVIFPCGAARQGDDWIISAGVHDAWIELHRFAHAELESRLVSVHPQDAPPSWWSCAGPYDRDVFTEVVSRNEYRLPASMAGMSVLDVGANVGSAAYAAWSRGAAVHCYEPWGPNVEHLKANASRMPGVSVFHAAIGGASGWASMPPKEEAGPYWMARPDAAGHVPLVPLEQAILQLAASSPSGRVGLLKMDAEGAEWEALAAVSLRAWRFVDAIAGEYHLLPGRTAAELEALLHAAGFVSVEIATPFPGTGHAAFFARR